MVPASVEIMLLLLLAGVGGAVAGFGVGYAASTLSRKRRTRDNMRRRLIDTQRAIVMLERTVSAARTQDVEPDAGTRLSERIAAATRKSPVEESEPAQRS
jgi:hypothetical protein